MIFLKNLIAFVAGIACQVLAGMFPEVAGVLAPAGTVLLSAANMRNVLNGSLWKHALTFGLGTACQVMAILLPKLVGHAVPQASGSLLAAGGLLATVTDLGRILSGIRTPSGTPDSPAPLVPPKP